MRKRMPSFVFAVTPLMMFITGMATSDNAWVVLVLGVLAVVSVALEVMRYRMEHQH